MNPKVHNRQEIHKGRVFDLIREELTLSNGVHTQMDIVRHPGAAAIVALSSSRELLMVKQYRHAVGRTLWEIPAGTLEKGESALECAQRELAEETGFSARQWKSLNTICLLPAYSDEQMHLFLAQGLEQAQQDLDDDEIIQVHLIPVDDIYKMITNGSIVDAKTIAAFFLSLGDIGAVL
jgi:ADP-ribose pyrophosphatase